MNRVWILIGLLTMLTACGGGGGSSSNNSASNNTSSPNSTSETFTLSGTIRGLSGSITLANGGDTLVQNTDGTFTFTMEINRGEPYFVKVISQPDDQICEVLNGRGFILEDISNVIVECASIVPVAITISQPDGFDLSEIRLLSNYEALGGVGEPALIGGGNSETITVSNNSFVTLVDNTSVNNSIIYLSFIDDVEKNSFVIDSATTALSLILIEPTVSSAIQDRELSISAILDGLVAALAVNSDFGNLSSEIKALADAGISLNDDNSNSLTSLQVVLEQALGYIASLPLVEPVQMAGGSRSESAGVSFDFDQTSAGVEISLQNHRNRVVSVDSVDFSSFSLAPYGTQAVVVTNDLIDSQDPIDMSLIGSGVNGDTQNQSRLESVSAETALLLYAFPSIKSVLGLSNPFAFDLSSCIAETEKEQFINAMANDSQGQNAIAGDDYYSAYYSMLSVAIAQTLAQANNTTSIVEIIDCDDLNVGLITARLQASAVENVSALFGLIGNFYSNQNITDLFDINNTSSLINAINSSHSEFAWSLGRQWSIQGGNFNTDLRVASVMASPVNGSENGSQPETIIRIIAPDFADFSRVQLSFQIISPEAIDGVYTLNTCSATLTFIENENTADELAHSYCNQPSSLLSDSLVVESVNDTAIRYSFNFSAVEAVCALGNIEGCPTIDIIGEVVTSSP